MRDGFGLRAWPWMVLAALTGVAIWHLLDYSDFTDTEFPNLVRSHFSPWPPAAYRLAEPGDTLDRVGLYLAAGGFALALVAVGSRLRADLALWPTALAMATAAAWHASTPGPGFDGWHGLGWRAMFDETSPSLLRLGLATGALGLSGIVVWNLARNWRRRGELLARGGQLRINALVVAAAVLVVGRQVEIPGFGPAGYWPRCSFDLGILAFGLALIRARPYRREWLPTMGLAATWACLVVGGIAITVYHRPLARLKPVVPGRIYISAMPTHRGLEIEQGRLGFRTIINLFDESSSQASPYHAEEIAFVREHGLRYLGSPADGLESDRFLDETLALARDPDAWPILIHCHGCMDRSPVVDGESIGSSSRGKPLDSSVFAEIERHRGSRPKAIVTLQYNRKLPPTAPQIGSPADPIGRLLIRRDARRDSSTRSSEAGLEPDDGPLETSRHPDRTRPDPPGSDR